MKNGAFYSNQTYPKIFLWGIIFILFLPIVILPPNFQPADWTRAMLFRITLSVLISFFIFKCFYKKELSFSFPKWDFREYLPFLALSAFIFFVILSTFFSQDPRFSFLNSPDRAGGSLNLLFYFFFAVFLALFIKNGSWQTLWKASFSAAFLASLLAIVQSFNFLRKIFISYEGGGAPSFLGNSTFLAIYMLFMSLWALVLLIKETDKKKKIMYAVLFFLFLITIFLSGSRATYLALVISLFFFLFFYPGGREALPPPTSSRINNEGSSKNILIRLKNIMHWPAEKKIKLIKMAAGILILLAVAAVLIFNLFPQISQKNRIFKILENRLSIKRINEDLFGTRLAVWQITLKAIKEKPILGWGPENFYIGFEKFYEPTAPNMQRLWWDRPHNIFLDVAVNYGIIALVLYIAFWIILLAKLQKLKRDGLNREKSLLAHGLQTMFIGYLIIQFFNFDSFATYLTLFFFIGYSFYLLRSQREQIAFRPAALPAFLSNAPIKKSAFGFFLIMLVLFLFFWNIKPLYKNEYIIHAKNISNNPKKCNYALEVMENAQKNPGIIKAYSALIYSDIIKKCATPEQEIEYVTKGLSALKNASAIQPKYTRTWIFMGSFANILSAREQNQENQAKLLSEARGYFTKALDLSPKRQEIYVEMEKNYLIERNFEEMKKAAGDCIAIDSSQGVCYWYLGIAEIFSGDQENGKKHIEESLQKGGFAPPYIQLGGAYISQNNYKDAFDVYHILTASYPENASYHAVMAFLSREIENYDRAFTEAYKVFVLRPDDNEVIEFMEELLSL
ncbi:MAG: O-antigen ligase family protein, partial [Patescibacteria group bacterium]